MLGIKILAQISEVEGFSAEADLAAVPIGRAHTTIISYKLRNVGDNDV